MVLFVEWYWRGRSLLNFDVNLCSADGAMSEPGPLDALKPFHPVVQRWFTERLGEPTEPQVRGWPIIRSGRDVLIAAPTGSGKTLTAFLACLDGLFRDAAQGTLTDETRVIYISPLKALGNDVQKNLLQPLDELAGLGHLRRPRAARHSSDGALAATHRPPSARRW